MYIIRPQFFIPIITILRNAALNSLQYKNELAVIKNQDIDITNFEKDMNDWKDSWFNTMKNAGKKHMEAIEQINKAIKDLEKTRDALILSDKHLGIAEGKLDDLTIKRLTRNNPTMAQKFNSLQKESWQLQVRTRRITDIQNAKYISPHTSKMLMLGVFELM